MHKFIKQLEKKKVRGFLIILLVVITWGIFNSKFSFDKYDPSWDMRGGYDLTSLLVKEAVTNHQYPLWVPYIYGGIPYFQFPQGVVFNVANLLVLILPSVNMAYNLLCLIQFFVVGITMYLLMLEFKLDYKYALIAVFTFVFNRYTLSALNSGGEIHFDSIMWLPAIFLFIIRAYKRKDCVKNSIFAGIFTAAAFHVGDGSAFVHMIFFIGLFFVYLIATNFKKYQKVILIFIILGIVLSGLAAIRLLPLLDFGKVSDLGSGRSFEGAKGYFFQSDNLIDASIKMVKALTTEELPINNVTIKIGLITVLLALLSLFLIKNRYVLFFVISILILTNVSTGSHLFYLLWKFFPGFDKQHHIVRILHLVPFCFSVLAGFGSSFLFKSISGRIKNDKIFNIVFLVFVILLFLGLPYKNPETEFIRINMEEQMKSNPLMVYLSEKGQEDLFRVHKWGLFNHIGGGKQQLWIPMGVSTVHGHLNTFEAEYLFQFINPVAFSNPTKILGMYNTKYFYSENEVNSSDLVFVKEFPKCNMSMHPTLSCEYFDPYLYLNEKYVPRVYIVNNTILVIAEKQKAAQVMYSLLLNNNFNPANLAIIPMDINDVGKYNADFFSRYNAIILLERPSAGMSTLAQYVQNGGKLLPNIVEGETSISDEQINSLLGNYSSDYDQIRSVDVTEYKPNSMKIRLSGDSGFVVIAEKYFMYEGWRANDNSLILRTNGFSSGVFVDENDSEIEFSYFPNSFKKGMIITLITLFLIIFYFVFSLIRSRKIFVKGS